MKPYFHSRDETKNRTREEETEEREDLHITVRSPSHAHLWSQKNSPSQVALLDVTVSLLKALEEPLISGPSFQGNKFPHIKLFPFLVKLESPFFFKVFFSPIFYIQGISAYNDFLFF